MKVFLLVLGVISACRLPCLLSCDTKLCFQNCGCNSEALNFNNVETTSKCDIKKRLKCEEKSNNQEILQCLLLVGCEVNENRISIQGNMDETDCIDFCTSTCNPKTNPEVDKCFRQCLKDNCSKTSKGNLTDIGNPSNVYAVEQSGVTYYGFLIVPISFFIFLGIYKASKEKESELYFRLK